MGRSRELDLLGSTLLRVREERSTQLVTLVGVPGIGKSRLVFELSRTLEREGGPAAWRQGHCLPYGDGVSFWALGEIVKAQAGILESDPLDEATEKLRHVVTDVALEEREVPWLEQRLRPLIGVAGELGHGEGSGESFAAWRRFLECLAERQPLVVVLEDLHWADEALLDFIDELADRLRNAALLVLCTARPELLERRPHLGGGKANAFTISLPPLTDADARVLVSAVLERSSLAPDVHETLVARAAGNPLYAEQFARVLIEVGSLDELPETVHGIIAARLDALPPEEKALLHDAAVVGKVFWQGALAAIADGSGTSEELLTRLERKEFLQQARRSSVAGEAEYSFRHALLRDVAYAQIPRSARADKHRRAAAWVESIGRQEDHAEMLAHHYLGALEYGKATGREDAALVERARTALRAAGERALALASYNASARYYSAALELTPETDPEHARLLVRAGRARHATDRTGIDLLEQGFEVLRSRGNLDEAAEVAVELARFNWIAGDRDPAYRYIDQALALTAGGAPSRARAYALVERAAYHMNADENAQAARLAREALPLTQELAIDELHVRALDVLAAARVGSGDDGGLENANRAIALASESNSFSRLIIAEYNLHCHHLFLGQLAAASEALSAFVRDAESYGTADQRKAARASQAHEAALHGHWGEAVEILDELIADTETGAAPYYLDPACHALRASIALARDDLPRASKLSDTGLERARRTKDPQILAPALTIRAIVELAHGRGGEASALATELLVHESLVTAPMALEPTTTPIELAWLIRDLDRQTELGSLLASVPSTPWLEAARAITRGQFERSVEIVTRIGAPAVEAYARLRAAQHLAQNGRRTDASQLLAPALTFYTHVSASRYLAEANAIAGGTKRPLRRSSGGRSPR